jgi:pimeloyl-ACP methyl ester carboxylesterase
VLLLHQTPRSWDEYRDVLPLLGADHRAIALDTLGFGASARPAEPWTIELFAAGVLDLCDALAIDCVALVGHHTGGVVAIEVAAAAPDRVHGLVLSATPFVDAERRQRVASRPPIDHVVPTADGSHLTQVWANRAGFYPPDRPDLLDLPRIAAAIPGARTAILPGTGVPAVDHRPEQFAAAVGEFLATLPARVS